MKKLKNTITMIVVLTCVITAHELGHFCVAKCFGIGVTQFSLCFGPTIYSVNCGETDLAIGCIPLGGYCRLAGQTDEKTLEAIKHTKPAQYAMLHDPSRWIERRPLRDQALVSVAGIVINILCGVALLGCWARAHPSRENPNETIARFLCRLVPALMYRLYRGKTPKIDASDQRISEGDGYMQMLLLNLGLNSLLIGLLNALPLYPLLDGGKLWASVTFVLLPQVIATKVVALSTMGVVTAAVWGRMSGR